MFTQLSPTQVINTIFVLSQVQIRCNCDHRLLQPGVWGNICRRQLTERPSDQRQYWWGGVRDAPASFHFLEVLGGSAGNVWYQALAEPHVCAVGDFFFRHLVGWVFPFDSCTTLLGVVDVEVFLKLLGCHFLECSMFCTIGDFFFCHLVGWLFLIIALHY